MTGDITGDSGTQEPRVTSQPLPPEVPIPRAEPETTAEMSPDAAGVDTPAPGTEWWRSPAGPPGGLLWDDEGVERPDGAHPHDPVDAEPPPPDVSGVLAAHEIGAQIGEAIVSHLPGGQEPSRRLDLSWLLLRYNVPGIFLAALVTWRGRSSMDRAADMVARDGIFAPVGVVLLVVLLCAVLVVLPVGSALGAALGHLVAAVAQGLVRLVQRAWVTRYIGYVLRLAVAVAAWSVILAVGRVVGRAVVHFLTGA